MTTRHHAPDSVASFRLRIAPRSARALLAAALLPFVAALIACGDGDGGVDVEDIESVEVVPGSDTLTALGQTLRLRAVGRTASGDVVEGVGAQWTTSDPAVATVDGNGVVTAVGEGEATIQASLQQASASADILVEQHVDRIEVTPAEPPPLTALGETTELSARVVDAEGAPIADVSPTWRSGDEKIVTVNAEGVVTAVANGQTTVVAAAEGLESDPIPITVSQVPARVDVSPDAPEKLTLLGETVNLSASVVDAGDSPIAEPTILWESSDESVATVDDDGLVTAAGEGESEITATSGGARSEPVPIAVDLTVERVTLSPAEGASLTFLGETVQLSARAFDPEERPIPEIGFTWVSSDQSVATVDDDGVVTAVGNGEVSITASAGGTASDPVPIVVAQAAERVEIASPVPDEPLTALGDSLVVTVEAYDAGESPLHGATYEWTSSDESVATVDESGGVTGIVRAVGNGSATITVTPETTGPASQAPPARAAASASLTIEVEQVLTTFGFDPSGPITLESIGETIDISAEALDSRRNPISGVARTWKSRDPSVATVDPTGTVSAVANGETSIIVQARGVTSAPLRVTVDQAVDRVEIMPSSPAPLVSLGRTLTLSADAFDAGDTPVADATFIWTSSPAGVVSVADDGTVTAVSDGTATVTATAEGVGGTARVTVRQRIASVDVSPESATLTYVGQTVDLDAVALDPGGSPVAGSGLSWSSSDESVATVDADGMVTAVGNGSAEVSVTAAAGSPVPAGVAGAAAAATRGITITVEQEVDRVEVTPAGPATLTSFGQTLDLTAAVVDLGGTVVEGAGPTTWTSSVPGVATVSSSGVVTAVVDGETSIVATAEGVASSPVAVTVDQRVASVTLSPPDPVTLTFVGETADLTAAAFDGRGNPMARPVSFTWMSDDPDAASVVGDGSGTGTVTAAANGTANVSATAEGVPSDPVRVTVTQEVGEVEIVPAAPDPLTFLGQTVDLDATLRDEGGSLVVEATVSWSSSDESVATVDADGTVTAVGNGSAEVSASATAAAPVSAGAAAVAAAASRGITITVAQEVDRVVITPPDPSPVLTSFGESLTLAADVLDAGGSDVEGASASWSSSRPEFATVDPDDGTVTAVAEGETSITATADGVASSPVSVTVDQRVAKVAVTPAGPATLTAIDETLGLTATALDGRDNPMAQAVAIAWESSNTTVAEVDGSTGTVSARANGSAEITAIGGGVSSDPVSVTVAQEIDQIEITSGDPGTLTAFDDQVTVDAVARDSNGHLIPSPDLTWSASPGNIVSLSPTSGSSTTATATGNGTATITASSDGAGGVAARAPALAPASADVSVTVDQVVTSLSVTPSSVLIFTDGSANLNVTARDRNNHGVSDAHAGIVWTNSNSTIATLGADGQVNPGSTEGRTTFRANADGLSAAAEVRVIEHGWPNEPDGFAVVDDRGWGGTGPWSHLDLNNDVVDPSRFPGVSTFVSPGGPFSGGDMLEVLFPEGMTGEGAEPAKHEIRSSELEDVTEVFVGLWWKASADWHNHPSGVNKIFFIWPTCAAPLPFAMRDIAPDDPEPTFEIEAVTEFGAALGTTRLRANAPVADPGRVVPGTWHRIEIYLRYSSGATGDGIVRWWVDGQLAGDYTNVEYPAGGEGLPDDIDTTTYGGFCQLEIAPTWGGFDDTETKAHDDFYFYDHTYISRP